MKTYGRTTADLDRTRVGVAEYAVASGETVLTTSGLGSCLGIALYDPEVGVAGLVHVMLPDSTKGTGDDRARFADTGIRAVLEEMESRGADRTDVVAKLAGGSEMFSFSGSKGRIGERNAERARGVLADLDVPVVAEDVGGERGRSIRLRADTGDLTVRRSADDRGVI